MGSACVFMRGMRGVEVARLKQALCALPGEPARPQYAGVFDGGDEFNADTDDAVRHWQTGAGLHADGVVGPHCLAQLGLATPCTMEIALDVAHVQRVFPQTCTANIATYLPYVADALRSQGLRDRAMILAALGTIRAETAGFVPIGEFPSRFNTLPGCEAFSTYDPPTVIARRLGNTSAGDGARYRGRGFVQLTGRANYSRYGELAGVALVDNPELANSPEIAALLLALFLGNRQVEIRGDLARGDFRSARRRVNGGSYGLDAFQAVFAMAPQAWPPAPVVSLAPSRNAKTSPPRLRSSQ